MFLQKKSAREYSAISNNELDWMRYIFDISDTGGKNVKLTWDLDGENLKDYVDFLVS